jgi:hypothetical protein
MQCDSRLESWTKGVVLLDARSADGSSKESPYPA